MILKNKYYIVIRRDNKGEFIMNYSYQNPYGAYPYNSYGNNYVSQQPTQQMPYQQTMNNNMYNQQQTQVQQNYLPLTFVNGIEGAKAFIVNPNQVIYLKDSDSDVLFEKKADSQGKYTLLAYKLTQVDINNIGKTNVVVPQIKTDNFLTKEDIKDFITNSELDNFSKTIEGKLGQLSSKIEKLYRTNSNTQKSKDSE